MKALWTACWVGLLLIGVASAARLDHGVPAPRCAGGEIGYWQPLTDMERRKFGVVLTRIDTLTPESVICRLGPTQRVQALGPEV